MKSQISNSEISDFKSAISNALAIAALLCSMVSPSFAAPAVKWDAQDFNGNKVSVPADRPSVIAFVRVDQGQSKDALKHVRSIVTDPKKVQVVVVLSGPLSAERVAVYAGELPQGWATVADPNFAASGKMNIHVWPTTLVVKADGTEAAHLAGLPKSYAHELQSYLDFAAGKIDEVELKQKLTSNDIVTDSPEQAAARHVQVAQRMLDQGRIDQARVELAEALKAFPRDPMLQVTLARVHVLLNEPSKAIEILDKLPADSGPAWRLAVVRGRALIALGKWDEAKSILPEALKLNPNPSEAHYLLGLCFQHENDFRAAAEQFRLAFEKSAEGQKLATTQASK
jgi:predicted negative regulator of RcsB-dependent stress response